jgi:hypothetical protein
MLSFIRGNDQQDYTIDPGQDVHLESDGTTVYLVKESITTANIIDVGLENGALVKLESSTASG